ncbi:tripartite tricarboxylate transporter TctB family protein [Petroclostridium sp. X23]|uniref:tripartite tricarboxylate transporter TctB family protein n=1 Tax=Petroclostridium sp. X23 TaxID=3045146 RepID=UPI0024AD8D38|nr:tripartite tricarboxylate transporter TctB family protein [Petroclostridium sp. X23]WHH61494.1 tripartite tricarboxylate transporter TctB family protein [Petroclostridium sp. X23]
MLIILGVAVCCRIQNYDFFINYFERSGDNMDKVEITEDTKKLRKIDIITGIILFVFGFLFFLAAIRMPVEELTGSPGKWFVAPGIFPAFIGLGLMFQAIILLFIGIKEAKGINKEDFDKAIAFLKTETFARFLIALGLLTIYIFVLLGRVRYEISTFIYLFINMSIFKTNRYAIWKIIIICGICSVVVGYGFSNFAKIPLP